MPPPSLDLEHALRQHGTALRELAATLLRNDADADDAVQEVWLGALQRPPADGRSTGGWLSTVLKNVARKQRRGEARRARRQAAVARQAATEDGDAVARQEQAQRLVAAVSALEPPYRDVIWQRYFEGLAPREIARANGEPVATVQSRLQRGLQKLRTRLRAAQDSDWRGALAMAFGLHGGPAKAGAGAVASWQGVTLMTTWTKSMVALTAIVALSLVAALVWFAQDANPRLPDVPGATTSTAAPPAASSADDTRGVAEVERVAVPSEGSPSRPAFVEVRVRDEETSAAVAGASVLFVEPGFALAKLTPEQRELYSRASESFLRDFGVIQTTDANGATRIPVAAAGRVVVARKGELYGTNRQRSDGAVQEILVSRRHTLVVETADEFGNPVPRVKVIGQKSPSSTPPALSLARLHSTPLQWTLGTTDDNGILTHVLESAGDSTHARVWLYAELVGGAFGRQEIDLRAPPPFVRLTLPATGTVRVRLVAADGSAPTREIRESLHAELSIAGEPKSARYAKLDAAGGAAFDYVALGQSLRLRFPGMVLAPRVFDGPTEGERDVDIVQALDPNHPLLVGTLLDENGDPIADRRFSIFCRSQGELLASIGADTDSRGRFRAYISDRCLGATSVEITAGMDMDGVRFAREARVTVAGPLYGRIDLGEIALPDRN